MPAKLVPCLLVLLLVQLVPAQGRQTDAHRVVDSHEAYVAVMEELFAPPEAGRPRRVMASLRFAPSFQSEQAIVLSVGFDQRNEVTVFTLKAPIWKKLREAGEKHQQPTVQEVAAAVGMQRRRLTVESAKMKRWLVTLTDASAEYSTSNRTVLLDSLTKEPSITLDGIQYNLILETMNGRTVFDLSGPDSLDEESDVSIIKAMNSIRREVAVMMKDR